VTVIVWIVRIPSEILLFLALLASLPAVSQNFIFASPNTSEELPLAKAEAGLNSSAEQRMLAAVQYVLCRVRSRGEARRAIGVWVGGTENSVVVQTNASGPDLGYAAAWLGRFGSQRTVLTFEQKAGGPDRLFRLEFLSLPDHDVIAAVEKNRLIDMTLIPGARMTLLIAGSPSDRKHVEETAKALNVPPREITEFEGSSHLFGDGFDGDKGKRQLKDMAGSFERQHPELERRACGVAPK
jgi:hypothetical protein